MVKNILLILWNFSNIIVNFSEMKPTWSYVREALSKRFRASCMNIRLVIAKWKIEFAQTCNADKRRLLQWVDNENKLLNQHRVIWKPRNEYTHMHIEAHTNK